MKNKLWQLSACELAEGIREKQFSAEEVIYSVISRIDEHNPRLNAIVADYREEALISAREAALSFAPTKIYFTFIFSALNLIISEFSELIIAISILL